MPSSIESCVLLIILDLFPINLKWNFIFKKAKAFCWWPVVIDYRLIALCTLCVEVLHCKKFYTIKSSIHCRTSNHYRNVCARNSKLKQQLRRKIVCEESEIKVIFNLLPETNEHTHTHRMYSRMYVSSI